MGSVAIFDDVLAGSSVVRLLRHAGKNSRVGMSGFWRGGKKKASAGYREDDTTPNLRRSERGSVVDIWTHLVAMGWDGNGGRRRAKEKREKREEAGEVKEARKREGG